MTNENGLIKRMYDKYVKHPIRNTLLTGVGLATIVGTFGGNEGGLAPFYNKKSGTWGGINVGVYNEFQENSKFYGLSIGVIQSPNKKEDGSFVKHNFYGAQIGLVNAAENLNGAQIGFINGAQMGFVNMTENLNGAQIGLVNAAENLNGMQIGGGNLNQKGWSTILNFAKGE
ncbi:MAG: hypothetical protein Q8O84_05650 [Nanoarchaeota archaeon]|nr:hypothetical protein [Nanoarchaeota archaeon]